MSEPPNGRSNDDGFRGGYPAPIEDWAEQMYRDAGMEPPWLLEYEDGRVISPAEPRPDPAPRHEV